MALARDKIDKKKPFYVPEKWYSLTINPTDSHQGYFQKNRYGNFRKHLCSIFREIFDGHGITYIGNIELSEPKEINNGKGPRLHYHGRIQMKDPLGVLHFLLQGLPLLAAYGHTDIDEINDIKYWDGYCQKQKDIMPNISTIYSDISVLHAYNANAWIYEAPEGLPQGRGESGLATRTGVNLRECGSGKALSTEASEPKHVSILDWIAPPSDLDLI